MLFNNFLQTDPDFQEMRRNWQNNQSEDPQVKKETLEGCHLHGDAVKSRLPDILENIFWGQGPNKVSGFNGVIRLPYYYY